MVLDTAGRSFYEAASNALEFFESSAWKGSRPVDQTVLIVSLVGTDRPYRVLCRRVQEWSKKSQG